MPLSNILLAQEIETVEEPNLVIAKIPDTSFQQQGLDTTALFVSMLVMMVVYFILKKLTE